jgi:hypothetical protein
MERFTNTKNLPQPDAAVAAVIEGQQFQLVRLGQRVEGSDPFKSIGSATLPMTSRSKSRSPNAQPGQQGPERRAQCQAAPAGVLHIIGAAFSGFDMWTDQILGSSPFSPETRQDR